MLPKENHDVNPNQSDSIIGQLYRENVELKAQLLKTTYDYEELAYTVKPQVDFVEEQVKGAIAQGDAYILVSEHRRILAEQRQEHDEVIARLQTRIGWEARTRDEYHQNKVDEMQATIDELRATIKKLENQ